MTGIILEHSYNGFGCYGLGQSHLWEKNITILLTDVFIEHSLQSNLHASKLNSLPCITKLKQES